MKRVMAENNVRAEKGLGYRVVQKNRNEKEKKKEIEKESIRGKEAS